MIVVNIFNEIVAYFFTIKVESQQKKSHDQLIFRQENKLRALIDYHQSIKEVETRNLVKYLITLLIRYLNICKPIISGF